MVALKSSLKLRGKRDRKKRIGACRDTGTLRFKVLFERARHPAAKTCASFGTHEEIYHGEFDPGSG